MTKRKIKKPKLDKQPKVATPEQEHTIQAFRNIILINDRKGRDGIWEYKEFLPVVNEEGYVYLTTIVGRVRDEQTSIMNLRTTRMIRISPKGGCRLMNAKYMKRSTGFLNCSTSPVQWLRPSETAP